MRLLRDCLYVVTAVIMLIRNGGGVMGICIFETVFSSSLPQKISIENISLAYLAISSPVLI